MLSHTETSLTHKLLKVIETHKIGSIQKLPENNSFTIYSCIRSAAAFSVSRPTDNVLFAGV